MANPPDGFARERKNVTRNDVKLIQAHDSACSQALAEESIPIVDYNQAHAAILAIGNDAAKRVKFLNALRSKVAPGCPKNKVGTPMVSDFDLWLATAEEILEAARV